MAQAERETARWLILLSLHVSSPNACGESLLRRFLSLEGIAFGEKELRRELDYLEARGLITLQRGDHVAVWMADIARSGVDLVEYAVPCDPGIARPPRH
jgi:hypothetical protein